MSGTRVVFKTTRVRVFHDCETHETRWDEFDATSRVYENGGRLFVMTRCDGSLMEAWENEPGVEVLS